jgi:Putative polyhydroxyalkanoic acid system protein (PHA_gran_rgn)
MPENTVIPTGLPMSQARPVLEQAMASYQEKFAKYDPTFVWASETRGRLSFKAMAQKVEGELILRDGEVEVTLKVPFLLKPFRQKALDVVKAEVDRWVAKAKAEGPPSSPSSSSSSSSSG